MALDDIARLMLIGGVGLYATVWWYHDAYAAVSALGWSPRPRWVRILFAAKGQRVIMASVVVQGWALLTFVVAVLIVARVLPEGLSATVVGLVFLIGLPVAVSGLLVLALINRSS